MSNISTEALELLTAMMRQAEISCETNTDEQAIEVQILYPKWDDIPDGTEMLVDKKVNYDEVLYKVIQKHNKQATYNPKDATSLFTPIKKDSETGTLDNPIAWVVGMESKEGLYYTENDKLYICIRDSGIGLYYEINALIGTYFEEV